jgi:hypothetical protein
LTLIACIVPLLLALTWVTEYGWTSPRVEGLLAWAAVMLACFLYAETKAAEPLLPLTLFHNPIISICSIGIFVAGMGLFGVIIYLPLFMQGVMNASATQSGTLLTPLMFGMVTGSFLGGQLTYRLRKYKAQGVTGSILVAAGMAFFAQMNGATPRVDIIYGMVLAGVGMGLIQTTYTVAVQNAAPRRQMGAATASTMFFRSVGSTLGVAVFGSVLLTSYHRDFAKGVPPGTSPDALQYFTNPLLLVQMRPQLESIFSRTAGGLDLMRLLMVNVRGALTHGLHMIFVSSAVLMTAAIALNLLLKNVPLRSHQGPAPAEPPAH